MFIARDTLIELGGETEVTHFLNHLSCARHGSKSIESILATARGLREATLALAPSKQQPQMIQRQQQLGMILLQGPGAATSIVGRTSESLTLMTIKTVPC